ncbi:hypothetical protein ASF84_14405 [Pseudomonas sp. Leaf127]|uniref:hypothetical protein n=1 Tax=Pseudomonas sp. Leaf127 TaxID=1736267 RepID=UPI000702D598|nr:hypothetical protein [Pseudomonas sp. Leaf127]KQQ54525.1 hypothetical protein ASF84_14405 [Pseudomonas sp. Leaf127]
MKPYLLSLSLALLAGCSTGPYLHPDSPVGTNALLSRTCPGPKAAMSYAPQSEELNWVHVLVYAAPPGAVSWPDKQRSTDTELRLFGRLYTPPRLRNLNTPEQRQAAYKQTDPPLWVSAASPIVTVTLANGETYPVSIEQLKTGFDPRKQFHEGFKGTALGQGDMDDFTLTFPDIFVNGEKIPMAPVHFKKREERYAPVFNC